MSSLTAELFSNFKAVIDQSTIPMYLTDEKLVVQHCNSQLGNLINSDVAGLINVPLDVLIKRFSDRVPQSRRECFLKSQIELAANVKKGLNPRSYRIEYIDNRELVGGFYDRFYRVTIHSEKLYIDKEQPFVGVFSVYHVVETDELIAKSTGFDVFISYASDDSPVACELRDELEERDVRCFMAEKEIEVAMDWQESIQAALHNSTQVLLVLTPRSLNRPWVLMEAGAAWALGKHMIPALSHVRPDELPDPIRRHQGRSIETTAQRKALVDELSSS